MHAAKETNYIDADNLFDFWAIIGSSSTSATRADECP